MTTAAAPSRSGSKKSPVKVRQTKMLIDGKWVDSASGKTFETLNPATGDVIANVAEGDKADVDKAAKAGLAAPALIFIGGNVLMHEKLSARP